MTTSEPRTFPFGAPDRLEVEPLYAGLRRDAPMLRIQMPYGEPAWLATRYEDIRLVLGDPRFSRAESFKRDQPRLRAYVGPAGQLANLDAPEHTRMRRLLSKGFTMRRVDALRPRVQQLADDLVDAMLAKGAPADLVEDFALPLPITVICELLGVPYDDHVHFRTWSEAFMSTTKFTPDEVAASMTQLREYIVGLIAQRRAKPEDDLMSALIAARDEEDRLSEEELLSTVEIMLVAGHETTASQIPNFVYILLTHPEELERLREDLDLVPRAVEELLRFIPLGNGATQPRYALEDVEMGGVIVRAGEPVVGANASAHRDESVYTDPDELDLARKEAPHLAFGHGIHTCLGQPLARMELQVTLHTLLSRLPGLRFADREQDITWKSGVATRGPLPLNLTWDQR